MVRCLITNGSLGTVAHWLANGIELVQIRERHLAPRELAEFTREILTFKNPNGTKILVNDRADVAIACGAHGVHLRDGSVSPKKFARPDFTVTVSCHNIADLDHAAGASYILLAPIFKPLSKIDTRPALGTAALAEAARRSPIPVLALGGITTENARLCVDAGAAGIAGITYFAL
jgi:thiamine-phosphate pyrophosphorylase